MIMNQVVSVLVEPVVGIKKDIKTNILLVIVMSVYIIGR